MNQLPTAADPLLSLNDYVQPLTYMLGGTSKTSS
jgi:hypothetical protein